MKDFGCKGHSQRCAQSVCGLSYLAWTGGYHVVHPGLLFARLLGRGDEKLLSLEHFREGLFKSVHLMCFFPLPSDTQAIANVPALFVTYIYNEFSFSL